MDIFSKEPTLEEYGLDANSYIRHKKRISDLMDTKASLSFSFLKALFTISLPIFILSLIFLPKISILNVLLSLIPLAWFDDLKTYFDNRNEEIQKIKNEIQVCKKNYNTCDFDNAISKFCEDKLNSFFKDELYRKRADRSDGIWFITMMEEASEIGKITGIPSRGGNREYINKRFGNLKKMDENIIFNFSKLINNKKGEKITFYNFKAPKFNELREDTGKSSHGVTPKIENKNEYTLEELRLDPNKKIKEEFRKKRNQEMLVNNVLYVENKLGAQEHNSENINQGKLAIENTISTSTNKDINSSKNNYNTIDTSYSKESKGFFSDLVKNIKDEMWFDDDNVTSTEEFVNTKDIISPEKKYTTPRKIDWENINKNKSITGMKGEEIVMEIEQDYLRSVNREDLALKVKHVSKIDGDGSGYDILSFFSDGHEKYIEVKSSKNSNTNSFNISKNELDYMKENKKTYQIYRIFNVNESDNIPTLMVHTADEILEYKKITPVQYSVKME